MQHVIVLTITAAIFVIVAGLAVYTLIRFGRRSADPESSRRRSTAARGSSSRGRSCHCYTRYSSVDDQALAGAIMWVPGSLPLLLPMLRLIVDLSSGRVATEGHHA